MKTLIALLLMTTTLAAADMKVQRDIPYAGTNDPLQSLDVYAPKEGTDHPMIVWIHGGGWKKGDKGGVRRKAEAFVDRGFVFISINYRFRPAVTVSEMTSDIAKAIRWAHSHAAEFGGSDKNIFVAGASSGAHLSALVCTDGRYLEAEGLSLAHIKGCIPVDVSVYDIPKRLGEPGTVPPKTFIEIFSESEETQRDLSPAHHVQAGKNIPAFLILHVASRPDTRAQAEWLAKKLTDAGVQAEVVAAEGKTHSTINSEIGLPDDEPTKAIDRFLSVTLQTPVKPSQAK